MITYEIYMPAGDVDWLDKNTPIAVTNNVYHMMHYVFVYHNRIDGNLIPKIEGPIYVKRVAEY